MITPPITRIIQRDTHRLIPSKYDNSVLSQIADNEQHLSELNELECATNDRILGENNLLPGIRTLELVYRVPYDSIINAAFCYAHPNGSRFNGPERGAWYAGFTCEAAIVEVVYHKTQALQEIDFFHDTVEYHDFLADFSGGFHDIRGLSEFENCLKPDSYVESQILAKHLLENESLGIIYPSVRHSTGTNIVCFRPALVNNVRRENTYQIVWDGNEIPTIT